MRPLAALSVVLALCIVAPPAARAAGWAIEVDATPVLLDGENSERIAVGRLRYRGGLRLESESGNFGGFSGMTISADGNVILAITDTGRWLRARLIYVSGELAGITDTRMGTLHGTDKKILMGRKGDSEGLTRTLQGELVVAFERHHRLRKYQARDQEFRGAEALTVPPDAEHLPNNGGMEAIATLKDGRMLVFSEAFEVQPGHSRAWIGDGENWHRLSYATDGGFQTTGADTLPNGDVIVLERRFNFSSGPGARLRRIPAESIQPGARLSGHEIATLESPLQIDNFEAVAARRGDQGETLIYLISDDNFSFIQRTLLLMFELVD